MKFLFDQNLSHKLSSSLADLYPGSSQVRLIGLAEADDRLIWQYAKTHDFTMVTQDSDFAEMALLEGPPPRVIWLRCGNQPTAHIEKLLRDHTSALEALVQNPATACLEIY